MDAPHDYCDEVKRLLPLSFSDHEKDLVRLGATALFRQGRYRRLRRIVSPKGTGAGIGFTDG